MDEGAEREAFEKWWWENVPAIHPRSIAWEGWKARAALSPPPKVKPLEWNPFRAETAFGYYFIDDQSDRSSVDLDGRQPFLLSGSRIDLSRYASLTDAKAAAQSDYEQRIRSALVIEPAAAPMGINAVEVVREAFAKRDDGDGRTDLGRYWRSGADDKSATMEDGLLAARAVLAALDIPDLSNQGEG
ncbi:hypothetical protein V5G24_20280 [Xanthobacter sp. VTT E-85241]|uniref:hypothetical protein n=1 Tax=Roseixanthobacter finlandensis TaxID=3119922 RepID=UPI00372698D3